MSLWKSEYNIFGKYALMAKQLHEREYGYKYFKNSTDVFITAPLVGLFFRNKGNIEKDSGEYKDASISIPASGLLIKKDVIFFIYRLIILSDLDEHDYSKKVDMAFRYINDDNDERTKQAEDLFRMYLYGGIEELYNRLIGQFEPSQKRTNLSGPLQEMRLFEGFINAVSEPDSALKEKYSGLINDKT